MPADNKFHFARPVCQLVRLSLGSFLFVGAGSVDLVGNGPQLNELALKALKDGKLLFRVRRLGGFWQNVEFVVVRELVGSSSFPILTTTKSMDGPEQVRAAQEIGLPIRTKNGLVFPRGVGAADFVGL